MARNEVFQSGKEPFNPGCVGDFGTVHRDVKVCANENAFSIDIYGRDAFEIVEQLGCRHASSGNRRTYFRLVLGIIAEPANFELSLLNSELREGFPNDTFR